MSREEQYELFDAYLEGSLSAEEQSQFDGLMLDATVKGNFDEYKSITNQYAQIEQGRAKEAAFLETLKSNRIAVDSDENEISNATATSLNVEKPKFSFTKSIKYISGLAACLLIGIIVFNQIGGSTKNGKQLFDEHFTIDNLSYERGTTNIDSVQMATELYNTKNYKQAQSALHALNEKSTNGDLQLAEAISAVKNKDVATAESLFKKIIGQNDAFREKAEWYLALLYLQQDKLNEAKQLLTAFTQDHFYKAKAEAILEALK